MSYPVSPFNSNFDTNTLIRLYNNSDESPVTEIQKNELEKTLKWLCTAPKITSIRVNTLKNNPKDVQELIEKHIEAVFTREHCIKLEQHPFLKDVIILKNQSPAKDLKIHKKEVIVDAICAASVLRGAHIYAPGVIGMLSGVQINDKVSVYADLAMKCKKGLQKLYDFPKVFIGNGIVKMTRKDLFTETSLLAISGTAVEMIETISNCPSLADDFLPKGSGLLQNIPSIICVYVLNPQPNDVILDMCAAPGNKTTHIAALIQNQGKLIAIDKILRKVEQLKSQCVEFGADVDVYHADSTKILQTNLEETAVTPLFNLNSFDKILLDVPCSVLGKRPQLLNKITEKVLKSYVPLQRKLFGNAVKLLRNGGTLVYSTCTITLAENEGIVAWALKTFECLELVKAEPYLGGCGLAGTSLSEEERCNVQRFGPNQEIDSVGFFIAKFLKKNQYDDG